MTFRVSQRTQARHDILELVAYIASEDPKAAAALYDAYERILATTLATTPDIGRPYASSHSRLQGVQVISIGRIRNYLIFYRRKNHEVEVCASSTALATSARY
jgi:plasmid stabilization system protein ParE